jgi:hypothetical protein
MKIKNAKKLKAPAVQHMTPAQRASLVMVVTGLLERAPDIGATVDNRPDGTVIITIPPVV